MRVGILALQGAFAEHKAMLDRLGVKSFEIRGPRDIAPPFDALIIPGGESTVMGKLLRAQDLFGPLKRKIEAGLPVFGTCAGLLLLARDVEGERPRGFQTMDILVRRNAYGRQLGSFFTEAEFRGLGRVPMTFIRAPYVIQAGDGVEILATDGQNITAARQQNQLVTAFHPELSGDDRVHRYFLRIAQGAARS